MQSRHFFADSARWGPSIVSFQAGNLRMLWLPQLENCSLGASGCSLAATRVDIPSFFGLPHAPFAHPAHTKKRIRKPPRTCQARNPDSGRGGDEGSAPCWHSPRAEIGDLRRPQGARAPSLKTILRARGGGEKVVWACGSHGGTKTPRRCPPDPPKSQHPRPPHRATAHPAPKCMVTRRRGRAHLDAPRFTLALRSRLQGCRPPSDRH